MVSVFPELLALSLLAPFLLRLGVGFFLVHEGWKMLIRTRKNNRGIAMREQHGVFGGILIWALGLLELLLGILIFIGMFTQVAALAGVLLAGTLMVMRYAYPLLARREWSVYAFLLIICFSLLFLGSGAFGFDLPL